MKIGLSILLTIFVTLASQAQSGTFTLKDFLGYVQKNHPVMVQADLLLEGAQQNVLKAKGGFDPVIGAGAQNKNFDEKNYYNLTGEKLKFHFLTVFLSSRELKITPGIFLTLLNQHRQTDCCTQE